jgi:putative sterol carrier protein
LKIPGGKMAIQFPTEEWVSAYKAQIDEKPDYKEGGKNWRSGPISLIINQKPSAGLSEDFHIYLDLHEGQCREARVCDREFAESQPFVIRGDYDRWKLVVREQLEPVKAMMQGKLKLTGDLPTIVRSIDAAKALVKCATYVETEFLDE